MNGRSIKCAIAVCTVVFAGACATAERVKTNESPAVVNSNAAAANASPSTDSRVKSWTIDDFLGDHKAIKRAWTKFEQSQKYRLAQPADRKLTPEAAERVRSNTGGDQADPALVWWGAEAYKGDEFLIAFVVDPSRSDTNRYGLVVIAAPESDGGKYKAYWVAREEDMESYLISPASGSMFIECYRRDGTNETKTLAWYRSRRQFELR
jgi:hypothetical protein